MLGSCGLVGTSGSGSGEPDVGPTPGSSSMGGEEAGGSGGGGGGGGNRWPRQETLALLKIRSDMDVVFRDSSLKAPLWEQVSRKMAELGYHRSAKKCKEKFENVYKYHKRTKDGRVGKSEGKTYRFFDQLQALEHHQQGCSSSLGPNIIMTSLPPLPPPPRHHEEAVPVTMLMPPGTTVTVPSTGPHPITVLHASHIPGHLGQQTQVEGSIPSSPSATQSSSSSTSSDEEVMGGGGKRKRKWKDMFQKMMKKVIDKQQDLHRRFLEAVEKREQDVAARDEAWKRQEIARLNREHEALVHERSMAAAKDAAFVSFLHNLSEQHGISIPFPVQITTQPQQQTKTHITQVPASLPQQAAQAPPSLQLTQLQAAQRSLQVADGDEQTASSSRWPKEEVEALIKLRKDLEDKYQDNGAKGPLWEEISAGMKRIGYNRNAKRCKEKWENINKYFKKVKESNKKRPQDSKTCPYFHLLDALYSQKTSLQPTPTAAAQMIQHEQQWPAQHGDPGSESSGDEEEEDDDDYDRGSGQFEIVPSNAPTTATATSKAE